VADIVHPVELGGAEQIRANLAAVSQSIEAAEAAVACVEAARQGLRSVSEHVSEMLCLLDDPGAIRPGEEREADGLPAGAAADAPRHARSAALEHHCRAIDAVAEQTRFGKARLLDGTFGCRAAAFGAGLEFVAAPDGVRSSPPEGYPVMITQQATRATLLAAVPLTDERIDQGIRLALATDGRTVEYWTRRGQSLDQVVAGLQLALSDGGLELTVQAGAGNRLLVQHRRAGSAPVFRAESSVPGVLAGADAPAAVVRNGRDVAGTLNGEPARGQGTLLVGLPDNRTTAGLAVRFLGPDPAGASPGPGWKDGRLAAGRVLVSQQRLHLRWQGPDGDPPALRLDAVRCRDLGRREDAHGSIASLADVPRLADEDPVTARGCILGAQQEIDAVLEPVRAAGERILPDHLARLRIQAQNLAAADQRITLPQSAVEAVQALLRGIQADNLRALAAQHSPAPGTLLRLLEDDIRKEPRWN
jgi:hypothetical protein